MAEPLPLGTGELRAVTAFCLAAARPVLPLFTAARPGDDRPASALAEAEAFAAGGPRRQALRLAALSALKAAGEAEAAGAPEAGQAARAAMAAAGAAFLHPLPKATQTGHILGAAAHAARAQGLTGAGAEAFLDEIAAAAAPQVRAVLRRYPPAPPGGGETGALMRALDARLRAP
ncbi:putative immunity protein [Pseudoroseicyclus sp. CXY001]|uniref:putative immunity protein n=1 Tax=Pseudoroseicyclus sp. CXY001 TaxID=3242492 RepID=UPI00357113B5